MQKTRQQEQQNRKEEKDGYNRQKEHWKEGGRAGSPDRSFFGVYLSGSRRCFLYCRQPAGHADSAVS